LFIKKIKKEKEKEKGRLVWRNPTGFPFNFLSHGKEASNGPQTANIHQSK